MSANIDSFINLHNSVNNEIAPTTYQSIEKVLFSLGFSNYIYLAILINLFIVLLLRFNILLKISGIYIWVLLMLLIIALAFSAYTVGELYTNLDSYVNIYNSVNKN